MTALSSIGLGFLEGLALIASPCILPVLPIVLFTSLGNQPLRPYGIVVGFALAFTVFTLFSRQLILALDLDPGILRQISFVLLLVVAAVMLSSRLSEAFARWTANLGQFGSQLTRRADGDSTRGGGFWSGLLIGACIGLVWVPCSGPILAAVLVQSIQQKTSLIGLLTLLAFAVGAGVPMLLIALGGNQIMSRLNLFKRHGGLIRKVTGVIILATVLLSAQDTWSFPMAENTSDLPQAIAVNPEPVTPTKPVAKPAAKLINGLPTPYPAPELTGLSAWFNTQPLKLSDLRGKVVLVDFWTYSCINCIRTLPHITGWDSKYRKDGLVIIGIHAPEFEFEKKTDNVARALKKYGIRYPVALDNKLATWSVFQNSYWPAHYLIDQRGRVVYTHFGEGNYDVTEKNIQALLGTSAPLAKSHGPAMNFLQTPETYLGAARTAHFASPQGIRSAATFSYPDSLPGNYWALSGKWSMDQESVEATQTGAGLRLKFNAHKVHLVMGTSKGQAVPVQIFLNGKAVGNPLTVQDHRLYTLLSLPGSQSGLLELRALAPGLKAYAFTFGS